MHIVHALWYILVTQGSVIASFFSWFVHQREKWWYSEALNNVVLFYQKLPRDGAGGLLCFLMNLRNYCKMGPCEWLLWCSLCKLRTGGSNYQVAHLLFFCFRCKSQEYFPFAPFWLLCCARPSMISGSHKS